LPWGTYREEICFGSVIFCSTARTHQFTWYENCPINTPVLLSRLFSSHKALLLATNNTTVVV